MTDEPEGRTVLGLLALSGGFAILILLDSFRLLVLPDGAVQVLLAAVLVPWVVVDLRRGDRVRAVGLGVIAAGNLAFLGRTVLGVLVGSAAILVGVVAVLAGTIGILRDEE